MRGITLVQGSIRKKLILTYSTVIFVFLAIIGVLLNITARRYLEEVLEKNLYAEASVIEELYRERTELLLSSQKEIKFRSAHRYFIVYLITKRAFVIRTRALKVLAKPQSIFVQKPNNQNG